MDKVEVRVGPEWVQRRSFNGLCKNRGSNAPADTGALRDKSRASRMRLHWSDFSITLVVVACTVILPIASAELHSDLRHHARDHPILPWLRRLRDSAVEAIFGRPGSRISSSPSYTNLGEHYRDHAVIRFNVSNSQEEAALSDASTQMLLDVWASTSNFVDIRIRKDDLPSLLKLLPKTLHPTVLIQDVAVAIWATIPTKRWFEPGSIDVATVQASVKGTDNIFFQNYQRLSVGSPGPCRGGWDRVCRWLPVLACGYRSLGLTFRQVIKSWMNLVEAMYPAYVRLISIGTSYEGRDIHALRIGDRSEHAPHHTRKTVVITGGLHGREWISISTVNFVLWSVITARGREEMITRLLKRFDFVFIPVLNPDGYEYTWDTDRLWRKSRQRTKLSFCTGFDLDHAFGFQWERSKHDNVPCSGSYAGEEAFEAAEAYRLAAWARNETQHNVQFVGFLDLHSYSQQVLYPYSYSCSVDPPNRENLEELAVGIAKAMRLSSGDSYSVASACDGAIGRQHTPSDPTSRMETGGGSAIDWFYHELHARYSYQIKLRDTGSYGFLLPSDDIIPTGQEMFNALKYFGDYLLGNNGIETSFSPPSAERQQWLDLRRRRRR